VFYSVVAAGLGCLVPLYLRSGLGVTGIRFVLGYAAMVVFAYVVHILLGISLGAMVALLFVLAFVGIIVQIRRWSGHSQWLELLVHPATLLIVAGATAIAFNGGIGYLPYGNDEFSHWLATPRLIHLSGSWAAAVDSLSLPFYTPGWPMTLLLPWQILGKEDFGMSAAAPFILHVTAIALIYDIAVFLLRRRVDMAATPARLAAWGFVLLFLAAEGMGQLWTYTLLIEQPQIYSYATVMLLIYVAEASGEDRKTLYGAAGAVLVSAYLYKAAALTFIPAIIGLSGAMLFIRTKSFPDRIKESVVTAALLAGPIIIAMVSWSMAMDSKACSPFTLSGDQIAHALALDWKGLADRFGSAVWAYVAGYKIILSIAAGLGVIGALKTGKYRAVLVIFLLSAVYFLVLYLYHLTCFGPYYFKTLNSIPRFTRVPLQVFQALGLVMLFDTVLSFVGKMKWAANGGLDRLMGRRWVMGSLVLGIVALAIWQGRQLTRSVVDTTTRAYQNIDPRINEMRLAARRINALRGVTLPATPILTVISQGGDNAVLSYARFFAMGYENGRLSPRFTVSNEMSWAPAKGNIWQTKASIEETVRKLSQADIIWPVKLDPWLMRALERLVPDPSCLAALPGKALIRDDTDGNIPRFRCIEK
jgi:hypothetical protein